ncbi:MAG: GNAT family N-acetyltransferase [Acidobacteria bacterium]|nr:GNAT family N-acetyltransferase [Acidobacteriota bacterium]MBI3428026.1 GNAT family N-acetyltransferase [Acidobacteriota bacterium]
MIRYRAMNSADIEAGLQLCRASRWNQVRRDWELFLRLSPQGCRVAVRDERVIGTVTTVRYPQRFSWIGMVLVDPAERGQGIGTQLLREAFAVLHAEPCLRLDATPAGYPVYRKLNFVEEYRLSRLEAAQFKPEVGKNPAQPLRAADFAEVCALDEPAFGAPRRVLLEWLWAGAPELAWIVRRGAALAGFVCGRHGFNFTHLGPLVAVDEETARQLVAACLHRHMGAPVILDVPQQQINWLQWLSAAGFREQRPLIRMWFRQQPGRASGYGALENQFAILGPEFG